MGALSPPAAGTWDRRQQRLCAALLMLAGILARVLFFRFVRFTADDALITFRYAENLASGLGFVYNPGDRVLGTTTPLLTLLLAGVSRLHADIFWSSFLINAAADCCAGLVILQFFRQSASPMSWLPALVFLLGPDWLQWCSSGMETELSISLLFGSLFLASTERWTLAFLVAALAVLNRIDGLAVPAALLVQYVVAKRNVPWKGMGVATLLLLPWVAFSMLYFGSPFPNSVAAKMALSSAGAVPSFVAVLGTGFLHLRTLGFPLLILSLIGTVRIFRESPGWMALPIWTWGYALSYSLAGGPIHPWYYVPFHAGYMVLAFAGLFALLKKAPHAAALRAGAAASALLVLLVLSYSGLKEAARTQERMLSVNREVGVWLSDNTSGDSMVAVKDIGYIGYYSRRRILDLAGLVSPECISFRARNDFLGPIRTFRPDYFAFSEGQAQHLRVESSDLMAMYRRVATIGSYRVYGRRK